MFELPVLFPVLLTFLLAGLVKGLTGMGLPTVCLALLTVILDLTSAMALMLLPSLLTNLWQALAGGQVLNLLRRLWLFFLPATFCVGIGGMVLVSAELALLSALLGVLLISYGLISLAGISIPERLANSGPFAAFTGICNGILTGMTGSFVVPGVIYLQAVGLTREQLIQAMGMLFSLSTLALAVMLQGNNLLTVELGSVSAIGIVPAFIGMRVGQVLRNSLSEQGFRKLFLWVLLLLGCYIVIRALFSM